MAFTLPSLPYLPDALEPSFDKLTMEIHHDKHHQAYVTNLNNAIVGTEAENKSLDEILKNVSKYPAAVRNNGGGHFNHSFFWTSLAPQSGGKPSGQLGSTLESDLGGFDKFREEFAKAAMGRFGSGWAWLCVSGGKLCICSTPNQDNPLMDVADKKGIPVLGLDVWEHAYYLRYQNRRADYIQAYWNVIDWKEAEKRYGAAIK
ncbi:MAG TPA: superoxide dismutase [Chitinophagaceae bacterium]|nr:superoxide dismutase [Chitinophagaceae bacterium]